MNDTNRSRATFWLALLSLVLGLSSVLLRLGLLSGLPAAWLGLVTLRKANASDGQLPASRLAFAGFVAGSIGVLMTVVGIVAIILLSARSTAFKAESANNLRVMGNSLAGFSIAHDHFPPATRTPAQLPPAERIAWMADVLPFLGGTAEANKPLGDLDRAIDRHAAWDAESNRAPRAASVRYFVVGSHPDYSPRARPGLTHYVGLGGDGEKAAFLRRDAARAGVFGHERGTALKEATAGVSSVLAVIETGWDNGPWIAGGHPTVRGMPDGDEPLLGPGRPFGGLHHRTTYGLWLDGSARPMADDIDPAILHRIVRLRRDR